jgi:hypothetical protein
MKIRGFFKDVDDLIGTIKMATIKNKQRLSMFRKIGYPPNVIITRWSSWLRAALYYANNLVEVKNIVSGWEIDGVLSKNV